MTMRRVLILLAFAAIATAMLLGWGYWQATRDPLVRTARIAVTDWPKGVPPVRLVLMSDLHVAGPDMQPERLARIVGQVNAMQPDLVLVAGDLVSDKPPATRRYSEAEAVAPLGRLRTTLGVIAVLGNHDYGRDVAAFRAALGAEGVTVLDNDAVVRGPLVVGGVDDAVTRHADVGAMWRAMARLPGHRLVLSHSPDIVPDLPGPVALVAAGHTHCGQISLPLIGRLATASRYGERFACGLIRDRGQAVVVSAGLGTSIVPLRYGVPPDLWLITLGQ